MANNRCLIRKYDCTIVPNDNPLYQCIMEVDAVGEEEACEAVRKLFRNRAHVTTITAHRERRTRPAGISVRLPKFMCK